MATIDLPSEAESLEHSPAQSRVLPVREWLAVSALVALADITIFRGYGYAGLAALFTVAPILLLLGRWGATSARSAVVIGAMLLFVAARSMWLGSVLATFFGLALIVAFSMALHGRRLFVLDWGKYALHLFAAGVIGFMDYAQALGHRGPQLPRLAWLSILLPLLALSLFGGLFVLANPDLVTAVQSGVDQLLTWLTTRLNRLDLNWEEVTFCVAAACFSVGLLRPMLRLTSARAAAAEPATKEVTVTAADPLFAALRNTLVAVIGLFAVYLVFEFATLWFREFPEGFHYSGYAHEGAFWLTAALALATLVLSLIFRGTMLHDPRLPGLKRLAWIWSIENLVLAATVYNRMQIYVDFNGMTRMRVVGLFGISAVVVGFGLVVWKIRKRKDFVWLVRWQLMTVALAGYLFALTPVDYLVHRYNVRQILAGDPAPSVQISVHPISSEGVLVLSPLLDSDDSIIREGISALLAERATELEAVHSRRATEGWTSYQLADEMLLNELEGCRSQWEPFTDATRRKDALERFHAYAYRWY